MINPWAEKSRPTDKQQNGISAPNTKAEDSAVNCDCLVRARGEHANVQHVLMNPRAGRCRPVVRLVNGFTRTVRMDERCGTLMHIADGGHYAICALYRGWAA